jgi:hypothetical protein
MSTANEGQQARQIGILIWVALLILLLLFLGLALGVSPPPHYAVVPRPMVRGIGLLLSALALLFARMLPARIGAGDPQAPSVSVPLVRLLARLLPCHGAALFQLGAYLAVRDGFLLLVFAVDLVAFLSLFPSARRFGEPLPSASERPGERTIEARAERRR